METKQGSVLSLGDKQGLLASASELAVTIYLLTYASVNPQLPLPHFQDGFQLSLTSKGRHKDQSQSEPDAADGDGVDGAGEEEVSSENGGDCENTDNGNSSKKVPGEDAGEAEQNVEEGDEGDNHEEDEDQDEDDGDGDEDEDDEDAEEELEEEEEDKVDEEEDENTLPPPKKRKK